jgi:hypothetical protein
MLSVDNDFVVCITIRPRLRYRYHCFLRPLFCSYSGGGSCSSYRVDAGDKGDKGMAPLKMSLPDCVGLWLMMRFRLEYSLVVVVAVLAPSSMYGLRLGSKVGKGEILH